MALSSLQVINTKLIIPNLSCNLNRFGTEGGPRKKDNPKHNTRPHILLPTKELTHRATQHDTTPSFRRQ